MEVVELWAETILVSRADNNGNLQLHAQWLVHWQDVMRDRDWCDEVESRLGFRQHGWYPIRQPHGRCLTLALSACRRTTIAYLQSQYIYKQNNAHLYVLTHAVTLLTGCWPVNECRRLISCFVAMCILFVSQANVFWMLLKGNLWKIRKSYKVPGEEREWRSLEDWMYTELIRWHRRHFRFKHGMAAVKLMQQSAFRRLAVQDWR